MGRQAFHEKMDQLLLQSMRGLRPGSARRLKLQEDPTIGKVSILRRDASARGTLTIVAGAFLTLLSAALPVTAWGNCTTNGTTVSCDSNPPNPYTSTIGTGPSTAPGTTVTLGPNAQVVVPNGNAISLGNNATINIGSGALVKNTAFNTGGLYGTGGNTIELNNNGTLTVLAGATVYSTGPVSNAEAVAALGVGNTIDNYGTIRADSAGVFFSDTFSGSNTIINEVGGLIQGPSTTASVIGTYASTVNFTNMGSVIGSLNFNGRNDQLHLYTGSSVTGSISDGGGSDALTLNGAGSGTLTSAISNFETLTKQDVGTWTLTGSISGGGSLPLAIAIQGGTLVLTGANTYAGGTTLSGGTLTVGNNSALGTAPLSMASGTALSFLSTGNFMVANNIAIAGDPNFAPPGGTVQILTGMISNGNAPGTLNMQGPGTLVLTGADTYTGGTTLSGGTLTVGNNRALGPGPLSMAAGTTLSFLNNFTFVGNNISIAGDPNFAPPGGTVQFLTGVISDGTAPGTLNTQGPGALVLEGNNSYTGPTTVNAGSLSIDGDQTAAAGPTTVAGGATLGGTGTIGGNVNVASGGTLAPGAASGGIGTLTVNGNLSLASGSILHYVLGEPTVGSALNDLTVVKGNLTLAGTLNVAVNPDGVFEPGIYRIIS
jgi:fibronectin-binding autotransporter adhesin